MPLFSGVHQGLGSTQALRSAKLALLLLSDNSKYALRHNDFNLMREHAYPIFSDRHGALLRQEYQELS